MRTDGPILVETKALLLKKNEIKSRQMKKVRKERIKKKSEKTKKNENEARVKL